MAIENYHCITNGLRKLIFLKDTLGLHVNHKKFMHEAAYGLNAENVSCLNLKYWKGEIPQITTFLKSSKNDIANASAEHKKLSKFLTCTFFHCSWHHKYLLMNQL